MIALLALHFRVTHTGAAPNRLPVTQEPAFYRETR